MAIKRMDDAENSTMATDLFAALFIVMLLAVGTTPAVKKAAADRDLTTEIPDKQPKRLSLYANNDGALHFSQDLDRAIPLASLSSVLQEKVESGKPDEVAIFFSEDATAGLIYRVMDLVEDTLAKQNRDQPLPVGFVIISPI